MKKWLRHPWYVWVPPTTVQFVKAGAGWHISYLSQEVTGGVFRVGEEAMQTNHSNP